MGTQKVEPCLGAVLPLHHKKIMISESLNYCKFFSNYSNIIFPSFKDTIAEGTAVKKLPILSQKYLKETVDYITILTENENESVVTNKLQN